MDKVGKEGSRTLAEEDMVGSPGMGKEGNLVVAGHGAAVDSSAEVVGMDRDNVTAGMEVQPTIRLFLMGSSASCRLSREIC